MVIQDTECPYWDQVNNTKTLFLLLGLDVDSAGTGQYLTPLHLHITLAHLPGGLKPDI